MDKFLCIYVWCGAVQWSSYYNNDLQNSKHWMMRETSYGIYPIILYYTSISNTQSTVNFIWSQIPRFIPTMSLRVFNQYLIPRIYPSQNRSTTLKVLQPLPDKINNYTCPRKKKSLTRNELWHSVKSVCQTNVICIKMQYKKEINAKHQFYHEKVMRAGFKARGNKKWEAATVAMGRMATKSLIRQS